MKQKVKMCTTGLSNQTLKIEILGNVTVFVEKKNSVVEVLINVKNLIENDAYAFFWSEEKKWTIGGEDDAR